METKVLGIQLYRFLQLILAITGLILQIATTIRDVFLVLYILSLVYISIILIIQAAGKDGISSLVQTIIEAVLGIFLVIYSIIVISRADRDGWLIAIVVISISLAVCFFLSAWDRN